MADTIVIEKLSKVITMIEDMCELEKEIQEKIKHPSEWDLTNGVRGGALILLVGAFEMYIKESIKEMIIKLKNHKPAVKFDKLPDNMQIHNMFETLSIAIRGKSFEKIEKGPKRKNRFPKLIDAGKIVNKKEINPDAFTDLGSNPVSSKVTKLYSNLGIIDIFSKIKDQFANEYELVPARNVTKFIMDKLDELVGKRHRIAHSADANQVTREDILGYIDFIHSVIRCLDIVLVKHFEEIIQNN